MQTGHGITALAAARRGGDVIGVDTVPELLERGRQRAAADHLPVTFQEGDAEELPFPDGAFDVVLSTFGVMFTPDQERAARELLRVCRFRYRSAEEWLNLFRTYYGPVHEAFAALDTDGREGLARDLTELARRSDRGGKEGLVVPSEYLEVVATR